MAITNIDTNIEYENITLDKYINGNLVESINLAETFKTIRLYEDINQKLISGFIIFTDIYKKFNVSPFIGNEKINIAIMSKITHQTQKWTFLVIKADYIFPENSDDQDVILYFKDEKYINFTKEFSTSFDNTLMSKFISDFSLTYLEKELLTENVDQSMYETDAIKTFAFPYQKFHYILKYLNQYIVSKDGYRNYLYYSDLVYTYYTSLSKLLKQKKITDYQEVEPQLVEENINYFSEYKIVSSFDIEEMLLARGFGSTTSYFDPTTKEIVTNEYKYSEVINEEMNLGSYSLFESDLDAEDDFFYVSSTVNNKNVNSIINENFNNGINLSIEFDGLLERRCGTINKLIFRDYFDEKAPYNETWTGLYLIKSITHNLYPGKYKQTINFIRNAQLIKISPNQENIKADNLNKINM